MINQIKAEFFKLQRNKSFWVLVLATTGLSALLHYLVIIEWWQLSGTPFDRAGLSKFNAISSYTEPLLFNLFVSTLAGFFISTEFSHGSVIKNQIISGSKRRDIILSKYLVFTVAAIMITILIPLLTGIIEVILLGHGDILNQTSILYLARAFGLFTLQFLGYTAIILLFAILTEDSGKTIIFSIIFTIIIFVLEKFSTISSITAIYKNSIFNQFNEVFEFSMTNGDIVKSIFIALLTFIILVLCGILVFNKKEIK